MAQVLMPCLHAGEPGVPASWLWPGLIQTIVTIWEVNHSTDEFSFSLCNSAFLMNKYIFKRRKRGKATGPL